MTNNDQSMPAYGQQTPYGQIDSPEGDQFTLAQAECGVQSAGLGSC